MDTMGEGQHIDLKLTFAKDDPKAKVALVKDLVAMANGGGGKIIFGCSESEQPGVDHATVLALDSAKLTNAVERFVQPASLKIEHEVTPLENSRFICAVKVSAPECPIVMSRKGDWPGMDNRRDRSLFLEGDIWIRHNSTTRRITFDALRQWIEDAKHREREAILRRISKVINVPEGAEIQIVTPSNTPIDSAKRLVEYALLRRANNPNYVLGLHDLLYLFCNRESLELNSDELGLVIASALRRSSTLYWWLCKAEISRELVLQEILTCLTSKDRDKSDAGKSIIEMAAIYASDEEAEDIVCRLQDSDYKHFVEAASSWVDRSTELQRIWSRIENAKYEGKYLNSLTVDELEALASTLAIKLSEQANSALSRKLSNVTRVIWSKTSNCFNP